MIDQQSQVFALVDEPATRMCLEQALSSTPYKSAFLPSKASLSEAQFSHDPSCLILDVLINGESGLDIQARLLDSHPNLPVIFLTSQGDIPQAVQAIRAGAIDFLTTPVQPQTLLTAIATALEQQQSRNQDKKELNELKARYESLSAREREIMSWVILGGLNKQIAADLKVSEITVKVHRGQVMRKMQAKSLVALVRMADRLGIPPQCCDAIEQQGG